METTIISTLFRTNHECLWLNKLEQTSSGRADSLKKAANLLSP
jgi:hypothetical protein